MSYRIAKRNNMKDSDFLMVIIIIYVAMFLGALLIAYIKENWY